MKVAYKDCEIEVDSDVSLSGDLLLFYSVYDLQDGFEVTSGFSEGEDTINDYIDYMKNIVDDYRENNFSKAMSCL